MKKVFTFIYRLCGLPFVTGLIVVALIFSLFRSLYLYMKFGAEFITYSKKVNRPSIERIFNRLLEIEKEENG